ncbi:MAG: orotate phosphoribosyltransferase [Ignisphaera sp.]|nr:orotate phosphoribosyltransferase [Ignisphaera sp.]MCX8168101.1 orotate phosphoribosyltransferase [Ignisphaera sp.]MDW8086228.1 orotate phosphoribosyltransferase [Ignisphaera sp.]
MQKVAVEFLKRGMIKIGKFKLTSGLESPFYIDLRMLYSHPELLKIIIDEVLHRYDMSRYDCIVGIATAGIAFASFLACRLGKPMSYVRIERKEHGTKGLLEGEVSNRTCIIVDDVATTGGSIEHAYNIIKEGGGIPLAALVIIDREQGAQQKIEKLGLDFYKLYTALELFSELYESGMINYNDFKNIIEYLKTFKK